MFRPSLALLFLFAPLSLAAASVSQVAPSPGVQDSIAEDPRFWLWPENAQQLTAEVEGGVIFGATQRVIRSVRHRVRRLNCSYPGGYGWVVDLASHPREDLTFVAGDNGIFVTSPKVDICDTVSRRDGAPQGRPVGIHVDDRGKLWICTDEQLGVLDTDALFGRTFSVDDGFSDLILLEGDGPLPVGPFTGFAATDDGGLLITTPSQLFAYKPGRRPPPKLRVLSVEGQPYRPGKVHHAEGPVSLQLEADAGAEPLIRFRRRGRHEWRPIDPANPELRALFPGAHTIDVVAFDRELNASEPQTIKIWKEYPFYKRTWFLGGLLASGELGMLVLLLSGRGRRLMTRGALATSMVVLLLIGAQLTGALLDSGRSTRFRGFSVDIDYSVKQCVMSKIQFVGLRRDGVDFEELDPLEVGDGSWSHDRVIEVIYAGPDEQRALLEDYNRLHPDDPLLEYKVQLRRWRMRDGAMEVATLDLVHVRA